MSRRSNRARRRADRATRRERAESTGLALYQPRDVELATARASGEVPEDVSGAEAGGLVPVDLVEEETPAGLRAVLAAKAAERRPVVPGWVRDRGELRYAVCWVLGHLWHTVAYHALRAPVYAGPPAYRWYGWGSVTPGANPLSRTAVPMIVNSPAVRKTPSAARMPPSHGGIAARNDRRPRGAYAR